jgi:CheY-like chemotaxis protein
VTALTGKRILIVEDEALVASLLEEMLLDLGASVVGPASTLPQAWELARDAAFDGAVLDVNIHGMRVDPLADALRRRRVPIVLATGYGAASGQQSSQEPVIEKPYTAEALARALEAAFDAFAQNSSFVRPSLARQAPER